MIISGDSLQELKTLEDNSIDSVVTDPPYGLSFMNKHWDYDVPSVELWKEVFRVLKPGGHLLSFAGSRTYHRMTVNIEDAGFEIRDQIMWVYGSGFPKSLNIGKAVDKLQNGAQDKRGGGERVTTNAMGNGLKNRCNECGKPFFSANACKCPKPTYDNDYQGWGTALKPAHEPIVVARKPISEKSIAENTLKWGTGGINIDASRVGHNEPVKIASRTGRANASVMSDETVGFDNTKNTMASADPQGRFPANFIHDGSDEVVGLFPDTKTGGSPVHHSGEYDNKSMFRFGKKNIPNSQDYSGDSGSAARFFYCAKASKSERNKGLEEFEGKQVAWSNQAKAELARGNTDFDRDDGAKHNKVKQLKNHHPTVKPIKLMQYLVKLVTPKDGTCLDPFNGSGTTGIAAKLENFNYIGIELDSEYVEISKARIKAWESENVLL